ncbi:phosphate/phosphite/phosphonate ABC transporter substrate-binding protein [Nonomuraea sp. NPDC050786]|uniref:phosphate/phosphite/phosphonate ABC transporter substrate-binding protein n=1 Tax=Nonomuraea sp. NPDC050786 TaxID=3154840 RepID=UPI0033D5B4BB
MTERRAGSAGRVTSFIAALTVMVVVAACSGSGTTSSGAKPSGSAGGGTKRIVFAAVPAGEASTFQAHFGMFVRALSEETGLEIKTFQAADYAGVIEALIAGTVDVAQLGAFSYALAVQNGAKIEPVGLLQHRKGDKPGYSVLGVARSNAAVSSIADFRGKTVCFPDPASTSTLIPLFEFAKAGLVPDKDFKRIIVPAGNTIPRTIKQGDCDVGLVADAQLENAIRTGDVRKDELKTFWEVRAPHSPLVMRTALSQDARNAIRAATLKINADYLAARGWCKGDDCLISSNRDYGYLPVNHSYYQVIWDACKATHIDACAAIGAS